MDIDVRSIYNKIDWDNLIKQNIIESDQKDLLFNIKQSEKAYSIEIFRKIAEKIGKKLYSELYSQYSSKSYPETLFDIIKSLDDSNKIPDHIISYLHTIRTLCNIDLHDRKKINKQITIEEFFYPSYLNCIYLLDWMNRKYSSGPFNQTKYINNKICDYIREACQFNPDLFIQPTLRQNNNKITFEQFMDKIIRDKLKDVFFLIGDAGTGKSTALKGLCYRLANESNSKIIPILIEMKNFYTNTSNGPEKIKEDLIKTFKSNYNIKDFIIDDSFIFILDGLDEYISSQNLDFSEFDRLLNLFRTIVKKHSNGIIISSRPSIWVEKKLIFNKTTPDFVIEMISWDTEVIEMFINKKIDPYDNTLRDIILSNEKIKDLCKTPFYLDIILELLKKDQNYCNNLEKLDLSGIIETIITNEIKRSLTYIPFKYNLDDSILWKVLYLFSILFIKERRFPIDLINFEESPLISEIEKQRILQIKDSDAIQSIIRNFFITQQQNSKFYEFKHEIFSEFLISRLIFDELISRAEVKGIQDLTYFCPKYLNEQSLQFLDESIFRENTSHKKLFINKDLENLISKSETLQVLSWIFKWIFKNFHDYNISSLNFTFITEELCLDYNFTSLLVPNPQKLDEILNNHKWKRLYLENLPFNFIPFKFLNQIGLTHLSIQGWKSLERLDANIGYLTSLEWLVLKYNNLSELPETIKDLHKLQHFNISHNRLEFLPSFIADLHDLKELELHWNPLILEPQILKKLSNLEKLTIDHLQFLQSPLECWDLPKLKTISIHIRKQEEIDRNNTIIQKNIQCNEEEFISAIDNQKSISNIDKVEISDFSKLNLIVDRLKKVTSQLE